MSFDRRFLIALSVSVLPACGASPAVEGGARRAAVDTRSHAGPPPAPMSAWVRRLGGVGRDECGGVHVDASGSSFVAGSFTGVAELGREPLTSTGGRDAFVTKLDPGGAPLWSRGIGSVGDDAATSVIADAAGNVYVAGWASGALGAGGTAASTPRIFVMALGPAGEPRWNKIFGGGAAELRPAITVDAAGAVLVAATFTGDLDLGPAKLRSAGQTDALVVKLSPAGEVLWARSAGGPGVDGASAIAVDPAGHVLVGGENEGTIDFGRGPIGKGLERQGFVVALDGAAGTALWGRSIGGRGGASSVVADAAGQITVLAVALDPTTSVERTFVAQLDPAGNSRWGASLGEAGLTHGTAAAEDAAGNVIVTGSLEDGAHRGEIFLARFDPSGRRTGLSRLPAGAGGSSRGRSVAYDRAGQMIIGGSFSGRIALAGGELASAGDSDVFIARLPPHGAW